ncbi:hypothetical protein [Corallococcus sicarius]|uniref:Uncharacterized protein n=1 Tax=Corallococcus sicarius TaxID=2316726 RepID=A0A3A8NXU1_9BACT|nr:hypothetical protein [Corallococcus sicarius]RKH47041.1 hypothetical protein D7X12_03955 [Corallococcus sicarius]
MIPRLFQVVLLSLVTVLGLFFANQVADLCVQGLEWGLRTAAFQRLSSVEAGVVRRLAELGAYALAGALLGTVQARALRMVGFQVPGWVAVTALGFAVGMVGSRALATNLGWTQAMAPAGLGVALGLAQWPLLRREAHGAVVWVAACAVGFGLEGPAAAWGERARRAALEAFQVRQLEVIEWTAQGMAVVALLLCTAIGAAFLLTSLRSEVLPGPRSRMPGAVAQLAVLGVLLPLLVALEARARSEAQGDPTTRHRPVCDLHPIAPAPRPVMQPRPTSTFTAGCTTRGCGPSKSYVNDREPPNVVVGGDEIGRHPRPSRSRPVRTDGPDTRTQASPPVVHDEHLYVLTASERMKVPEASARWNNAQQPEPQPSAP